MNKLLACAGLVVAGTLVAATASHRAPVPAALVPPRDGEVLHRYDLTPVLRTLPDNPTGYTEPMNGFFGDERYRIEFVITQVQRDPQQPGRYRVQGKNRFKGRITPFAGTLVFSKTEKELTAPAWRADEDLQVYTATGTYELQEAASRPGAGTFQGRIAADFAVEPSGKVHPCQTSNDLTQGGEVVYDGTWTSPAGPSKPAVWVADIWSYHGPQVLDKLIVGSRTRHFNAKYAKLGWNNYWKNDEWWASDPSAVAKRKW